MSGPLALAPGTVFAGDFRIVRELRKGSRGAVYEVKQLSTGYRRALKLMLPELARDKKWHERFQQEARISAKIDSDHVVQVMGAGIESDSGIPWISMELLHGADLGRVLRERGVLPWMEVQEVFRQLCHALGAAHAIGVVHRNLKPGHIFIALPRREGVVFMIKVLDFGLAKLASDSSMSSTEAFGTPLWIAPEQTTEAPEITPATDVWALGLLAFHMLTGKHYWRSGNGPVVPVRLLEEIKVDLIEPASIRAAAYGCEELILPGFNAWFARCVTRNPADRYADANAAREALCSVFERAADRDKKRLARAEALHQSRHRAIRLGMVGGTLAGVTAAIAFAIFGRCGAANVPTRATAPSTPPPPAGSSSIAAQSAPPVVSTSVHVPVASAPPQTRLAATTRDAAAPSPKPPSSASAPPAQEPSASPPASNCDPPYVLDNDNTRIPKPECM